ncbi:30S ribosomal protein S5 [Candidatus Woesearchaeota archaeon CG10_big_fil_rev_8_21_14_0_10_44_13]|nr:MAG: 30S ribosomal protein S5 [Candidatus Woesearchaeota archaeon CG10_big_fil_rev_8_21_14_0_10_44_13]
MTDKKQKPKTEEEPELTKEAVAPSEDKGPVAEAPAEAEKIADVELKVGKDIIVPITEEELEKIPAEKKAVDVNEWKPKTELGRKVKSGEIKSIGEILDSGKKILEAEITDALMPNLESDLLLIGQSKGKFGGGQRRVFKQTQKKTKEGNKPKFATFAVIGNKDGIIGLGYGKAKETVPAREKAFRNAKLNLIKIRRGCGSWQCGCKTPHSIPFTVEGKCGSVRIKLMPAPKGKGLCVEKECQKILKLSGIKDVWAKARGQTGSKINLIFACCDALKQLMEVKTMPEHAEMLGMKEGEIGKVTENELSEQ